MNFEDIKRKYNFNNIPNNLKISTLSACCKLNVDIYLENMFKYSKLDSKNICKIKYGKKYRGLNPEKSKKKKNSKEFFNQLTIEIYSENSDKNINIKIFKNGSLQMSGCKSTEDCIIVLNKLIMYLKKTYALIENNIITEKPFCVLSEGNDNIIISNFKVILINSNFQVPFLIKRDELYNILIKDNINCRYEPCIHACVNIKYSENNNGEKPISIFVFQSGNIIITGAKEVSKIINAYNYIKEILNDNIKQIVRKDINVLLNLNS